MFSPWTMFGSVGAVVALSILLLLCNRRRIIYCCFGATAGNDWSEQDLEEVQRLVSSAARDCVPQDRNSFVAFQSSTGVEVCTFKLVVKNASSLLDNKDPVKLEAEAMLAHLVRCFTSLNSMANEADIKITSNRQKVADVVTETISRNFSFSIIVVLARNFSFLQED